MDSLNRAGCRGVPEYSLLLKKTVKSFSSVLSGAFNLVMLAPAGGGSSLFMLTTPVTGTDSLGIGILKE